jgi:hypothetical protein
MGMWLPAPLLPLSSAEQVILEAVAASAEIPDRVRKRDGIVLRAAQGVSNNLIAQDLSHLILRVKKHGALPTATACSWSRRRL